MRRGGGWYNDNRTLDVDSSKIASNGAITTKAIGDAFMGVAGVIEDKKKLDILEAEAKARNEKNQLDLSRAYAEDTQKAVDNTYLNYVDTNTGKFNQEKFDKDNVGLPMNQVSMDARLKQKQLENAYSIDLEKIDKKAQEEITNEVVKEMFKYGSKDEFEKNVNPDLIKYANGTTMLAVDKYYDDSAVKEAKLQKAKADIENAGAMTQLKIELAHEKNKDESTKPRDVKASDDSLMSKNVTAYFGGTYDPATGEITGLDKDSAKKVTEYSARASKYFKDNKNLTHNEATALALKEYEDSIKPKPTDTTIPNNDPFGWLNKK